MDRAGMLQKVCESLIIVLQKTRNGWLRSLIGAGWERAGFEHQDGSDSRPRCGSGQQLSLLDSNSSPAFYRVQSLINQEYAQLDNAQLGFAAFQGPDFFGANFFGANLTNANLTLGLFQPADFTNANLRNATTNGASFTGAIFSNTIMPDGSIRNF